MTNELNRDKIAKISLEKFESKEQILYDFDKSKNLNDIIIDVCKILNKPESLIFGLKNQYTKNKPGYYYISPENLHKVDHSDCLKLVYSVRYYVETFFKELDGVAEDKFFDDILELSTDPEFVKELERTNRIDDLLNVFIRKEVKSRHNKACLLSIIHLFKYDLIKKTEPNFLTKIFRIIKDDDSSPEVVGYSFSVLHKILVNKSTVFNKWKEEIIKTIPITKIIPFLWNEETYDLQYGALLLINTIIKCCKNDKRKQLIKEMNQKTNRQYIYKHIIEQGGNKIDKLLQHQLYVCQTYLLSLYNDALNTSISLDNNPYFHREDYELTDVEMKRHSILMDFDENNDGIRKFASIETMFNHDMDGRLSLATINSSRSSSSENYKRSYSESDVKINEISLLTTEVLKHYKKFHAENFYQSQIEEQIYQPGIFATSERIVQMLAKILHIGLEPEKSNTFYQPLVFNCSSKQSFFHELFSRTMWLLSKTRREMKVSTISDYQKVMHVLDKQIRIVLQKRPMDFKTLTNEMSHVSFDVVQKCWQIEYEMELNNVINKNPAIQDVKKELIKENEKYIFQQRVNCLINGNSFIKVLEKKTHGYMFVRLSDNQKQLIVCDFNYKLQKIVENTSKTYNISDLTHIAVGKNCDHSILCANPCLAFAVIQQNFERIKFIAKDERTASYWIDAFSLLLGFKERSRFYKDELNELVNMDVKLKLIELQTVQIPNSPPVTPNYPPLARPPLPPKPKFKQYK